MSLVRKTVPLNPRYVNYCRAHGMTADQMFESDQKKYPGGIMAGFLTWSRDRLNDCRKEHPEYFLHGNLVNHEEYDKWLYAWASKADNKLGRDARKGKA